MPNFKVLSTWNAIVFLDRQIRIAGSEEAGRILWKARNWLLADWLASTGPEQLWIASSISGRVKVVS